MPATVAARDLAHGPARRAHADRRTEPALSPRFFARPRFPGVLTRACAVATRQRHRAPHMGRLLPLELRRHSEIPGGTALSSRSAQDSRIAEVRPCPPSAAPAGCPVHREAAAMGAGNRAESLGDGARQEGPDVSEQVSRRMRATWDALARRNAMHFIATERSEWTRDAF